MSWPRNANGGREGRRPHTGGQAPCEEPKPRRESAPPDRVSQAIQFRLQKIFAALDLIGAIARERRWPPPEHAAAQEFALRDPEAAISIYGYLIGWARRRELRELLESVPRDGRSVH